MAQRIEQADSAAQTLLHAATERYHPELNQAEVRIGLLFVSDDCGGHALYKSGTPALALVRCLNARQRLLTGLHAVIELDLEHWRNADRDERAALLDHELTHLVVQTLSGGAFKRHADGAPKLKMRPDDWSLTGFADVVERHGAKAAEVQAIVRLVNEQQVFPFMLKPVAARRSGLRVNTDVAADAQCAQVAG